MPLKLLKGIRHFKDNGFIEKQDLFSSLIKGQSPDILFITCSDSRIIPSLITHSELGELFVIRNAGNIVPPYSPIIPTGEAATIEFALKKLNVKEIIVCGHSDCGAMKGLLTPNLENDLPIVSKWLSAYAQPALDKIQEKHPELEDAKQKLTCVTEENILLQMKHLKTLSIVKERLEANELNIHGWFYDIEKGEVFIYDLNKHKFIPFESAIDEAFNSEYVLNKMKGIIEEEAKKYTSPTTAEEYTQITEQLKQLKFNGINSIWDAIQTNVTNRLWDEFGGLCIEEEGRNDSRFASLIEKCPQVALATLTCCQQTLRQSQGYQKFCIKPLNHIGLVRSSSTQDAEQGTPVNNCHYSFF